MKLNDYINEKIDPLFQKGGKYEKLWSIYDSFHTFLFVPRHTAARKGVQVHDSVDSKRVIMMVILALVPAALVGMWNVGYQHDLALGINDGWFMQFLYGLVAFLPKVVVSYAVGLGIEMAVACMKREEVAEGFLATGLLIPMIVPVNTPLWMIAVATAFSVIFAKEIFGGTGMNIFNPALITRAFLFFAYPKAMSGDEVFVRTGSALCNSPIEGTAVVDGFSGATPGSRCRWHIRSSHLFYNGCIPRMHSRIHRRNIDAGHPFRRLPPPRDTRSLMANHVLRFRGWCSHVSYHRSILRERSYCCSAALPRWFCICCSLHGY
jgi:Na+-transporting NADH:ubiquinone oxidoreductase subunit NqrB